MVASRSPSLLAPTLPRLALPRADLIALVALWAFAFAVRWPLHDAHPYTAEAAHYVVARRLWLETPAGANLYNDLQGDLSFLFWQRPLFSLLLAPGAWVSFGAYRALHIGVSSLVPVLAVALLRSLGVRPWLAWPVGAVLAVHPMIVPWGVLVLPDSLMATLVLAGLLAAHRGRPLATGALLLAACWTKEVAIVAVLPLLALSLWRDPDGEPRRLWPVRLGRFPTALAATAILAFAPLLFSLSRPGALFPGWGRGGDGEVLLEALFLTVWLAPFALLALRFAASRRLALVSLAWSAFFLAYYFLLGRAIEAWYTVLPGTLSLMAAAAGLSGAWAAWGRPARLAVPVVALLLLAVLGLQVAAPETSGLKQAVVTPFSGRGQWSLAQATDYEDHREAGLHEALALLEPTDRRLLTVDVDWSFVAYPIQGRADVVYVQDSAGTLFWRLDLGILADGIETRTDAVLVRKNDQAVNRAVREVYADCVTHDNPDYTLLRGGGCLGRADELQAAVDRLAPRP